MGMGRGIILWGCILVLALAPLSAGAAHKASSKGASAASSSKSAYSRKIIHSLRSSNHYRMQRVNYTPNQSVFRTESGVLRLASSKALILNQETGEVLYAKNTDVATPIASVTKLMTAMVMLDAHPQMDEQLTVTDTDVDFLKGSGSRLRVGTTLTRGELLQLALMASENRAAAVLARTAFPEGLGTFVAAMNRKAAELGMTHSHFADGTGLNSENISTAEDIARMVKAAYQYPEIRRITTTASYEVPVYGLRRPVEFHNTNVLVRNSTWEIGLSKTGYINESGRCLVMQAKIGAQPLIIVLLDSWGKYSRIGDANRIMKWIKSSNGTGHRLS